MRRQTFFILACVLVLALAAVYAQPQRDEVVYARLNQNGKVLSLSVVNNYETDKDARIDDQIPWREAEALSATTDFAFQDGKVRFRMAPGRAAYLGTPMKTDLPWTIKLSFTLDGKEIAPEALSGQSGELTAHLSIAINDNMKAYAEVLALQLAVSLDEARALSLEAPKGTLARAGDKVLINYVILPGMTGDFSFSCQAVDFAIADIQMSAVRLDIDPQMVQQLLGVYMQGNPLVGVAENMTDNMLSQMAGKTLPSYAHPEGEAPRSLQFVMMLKGVPEKPREEDVDKSKDDKPDTAWTRIKSLFGLD